MVDVDALFAEAYKSFNTTKEELAAAGHKFIILQGRVEIVPISNSFSSLFYKVSSSLRANLSRQNIDYTKREICYLRKEILQNFQDIGMNEQTYDMYTDELFVSNYVRNRISHFYHM